MLNIDRQGGSYRAPKGKAESGYFSKCRNKITKSVLFVLWVFRGFQRVLSERMWRIEVVQDRLIVRSFKFVARIIDRIY